MRTELAVSTQKEEGKNVFLNSTMKQVNISKLHYKQKLDCLPILSIPDDLLNPILPGGEGKIRPPPKTTQTVKLKLSDFKDTPLRHLLQLKPIALATKLQKVPHRNWLQRKVKNQPFVKILS